MKLFICLVLLAFMTSLAFADILVKQGVVNPLLDTASMGSCTELELNKRIKNITGGLSVGLLTTQLKGRSNYPITEDTWGEGEWATRGTLFVYPILAVLKYNIGKFYVGGGGGLALMNFSTKEASVKNRKMFQGILGYRVNSRLGIEIKRIFCDLDIESGTTEYGIMEDRSNLNSWVVCGTWRF